MSWPFSDHHGFSAHAPERFGISEYPACQLAIIKDGELQIELNQNAWRLSNIIDWKGTGNN